MRFVSPLFAVCPPATEERFCAHAKPFQRRNGRALFLTACILLGVPAAHANEILNVKFDTANLIGGTAGPFSLDFQFTDGSGLGDSNNTVAITGFNFGTGGASGRATLTGGGSGNLVSGFTLKDSSFFNEAFQTFKPGSQLTFTLNLTTNVDSPTPDELSIGILDNTLSNIPTLGPGDTFVVLDINSQKPVAQTFASNLARNPAGGGAPINIPAPVVTTSVPEPATLLLAGMALLVLGCLPRRRRRQRHHKVAAQCLCACCLLLGSLATGVHAQTIERQIFTGTDPDSVAVNPVTNRIYVANESSSTVTVLDGRTYATLATINVPGYFGGSDFLGLTVNLTIAVNPVTNKVYVASQNANAVIVIDENNIITTVPTDVGPTSLAINTVTNKVYVANIHDITTIDGATNATSTVAFGAASTNVWGIAVNPTTNRVYAVGTNGNLQGQMLIINGATNGTQILALPDEDPFAVAVNQATNKIYTANAASGTVSIIDGVTNEMSTVAVGNAPVAVAVDEPANAVYVANSSAGTVSIINGSSNAVSTVTVGTKPAGFAINTLADQVYVIDLDQQEISIINGANGKVTGSIPVSAVSLAFNPVTNRLLTAGTVLSVIDVSTYRNHLLTPPLGTNSIAVNPVTNKIYAGSASQSTVFVYNGTTEALLKSIPVSSGTGSLVMALNTITNKIYAANAFSNQVAVINGNTDTVEATVNTGTSPVELVVDPIRNKIYVANQGSASVTIIDGETNSATSIAAGNSPVSIDVNTRSGQVCVGNQGDRSVTLIDGNTLSTTTVKIPFSFSQVIANQTANTAYVISSGIGVISNGALETTITVPSHGVAAAALEPLTDQLFAVDSAGSLYAIDGVTNALSAGGPPTNQQPVGLAIDPVTYKLYSLNFSTTATTAYDGASQTPFNIQAGAGNATAIPSSVGVNAVTQRVYIAGTPSITVIEEAQGTSPLTATISPLAGNATSVATPQFTFTAFNLFQSQKLPATNVYYQFDTWQGPWIQAMANGSGSFAANAAPLSPGVHVLYAYALDGEEAVSIDGGGGWITPAYGAVTGAIASYGFNVLVSPPATNVSGEVTVTRGGFRLDHSTGHFVQVLTVANSSNAVLQGPISLVLDDLSTKATLSDANGVTAEALPAGSPYLNLNLGTVNVLNPGQSVSVTLEFVDPSMQGISYSTRVLAGAGGR